jgi:hypothetical protein
MYGVEAELGLIDDKQLVQQYATVVNTLADGCDAMAETVDYVDQPPALARPSPGQAFTERSPNDQTIVPSVRSFAPHQDTANRVHRTTTRPDDRTSSDTPVTRRSDDRTTGRPHAQAFATARQALRGAWKRSELEAALSVSRTQAHAYIQAWLGSGDIIKLNEPKDHYSFLEVR